MGSSVNAAWQRHWPAVGDFTDAGDLVLPIPVPVRSSGLLATDDLSQPHRHRLH
jgi:hypothetical protein